ncbi:MAG TPA: endo-1,4-beta-xylanase [Puia sp.]|nr:endo-1,4-beta-xylanase [Puia sp.]
MKRRLLFLSCCLAACLSAFAQVRLPRLVRDSMILQRDRPIPIWGWAGKGERVSVVFNGKTYRSRSGEGGKWTLQLPAMGAGGPYTMVVSGKNRIVLHDILVGDVWLCSGQSNMVHQLKLHSVRYPEAIAGAHYPEIRQFWIPTLTDLQGPQGDLPAGHWMSAVPQDVAEFSAVAYFFARDLYEKYHVPIGIINASVGGTPIEAWISEAGLKDFPELVKTVDKNKDTAYINGMARQRWAEMAGRPKPADKGLTGPEPWYSPAYVPGGWRPIGIPGYWEDQGLRDLDGVVWYRREIDVPASMTGKPAKVFLGRIVNADALYINGKEVGNTTYEYPQRRYPVPADLLKPGKNLFVVRVTNTFGKGGFVPDKPYCLIAGGDTVDLKGSWEYKVGEVFVPHARSGGWSFSAQNAPAALYNAMIAPLVPYGIKGFVWYQGEANTNRAAEYARLQPAMIADWRSHWKEGDIPFLYVQLPGFGDYNYLPAESGWAELREAQLQTLAVPHTGMAVAIDLGEWNDIHPDRKEPVGDRLALAAEAIAYGDSGVVYSGPVYQSAVLSGGKVTISFTHAGGGLVTNDGEEPQEFAIAGADRKFVWANAKIEGDKVVVWSDSIKEPAYVRYAWADDPVDPNLYNKEGLPASPFETVITPRDIDHDHMMQLLGITALRPGPSGDEHAPNHANYDEAKANPCPQLPDILTLNDGEKVTTPDMWWKQRRPEIVAALEREVYGRVPANVPGVIWSVKDSESVSVGDVPVVAREMVGHVDNSAYPAIDVDIRMVVVLPVNVKGPVPVLMLFGRASLPAAAPGAAAAPAMNPFVKQMMEQMLAKEQELLQAGWGYVVIDPSSIQADNGAGLTKGIIGLVNKGQPRKPEDWGALRAWAWGAARGLDYLETESLVDANKVGIEGVSRYGKAALVTLAFEPRFAAGLIGSSGKGGATLLRRNYGEAVESLTGGEYYWMAGNFLRYGAAQSTFGSKTGCDLDVDSHELIALCAPRLTFISYGIPEKGDAHWLDHEGSYMATIAAGAVFKLLGAGDLGVSNDYMKEKMPPVDSGLLAGRLAWRQHDGGHTDAPNLPYFIQWANTFFAARGLKDYYKDYFPIGVSVGPRDLHGDEARLILQQFNSLTPENAMKMGPIHPRENVYHWADADSIVAFAQRNHLRVRGHNLCWHNQAPGWMFKDASGNTVTKEQLLQRLKDHITAVVGRYKGKIYAWDVVNEAVADDSAHYLRPSLWYRICGDEFIEKAFEYAHAADPEAVLFYNDYNTENPAKRDKIYRLLKGLLAKGVPVGGIGLQAHWSISTPTREELERSIRLFSSLGLQVQITELDISVYPGHQGGQMVRGEAGNPDSGFTSDMEQKQLEKYKMVFEVFRKYRKQITGVTFWNVSDRHSWLDNRGRKNYPLLFDKDLQPKKAYRAVVDF